MSDIDYMALWRRMDDVVMALTHKAKTLPKRLPKRKKLHNELIDLADHEMMTFFCLYDAPDSLISEIEFAEEYIKKEYGINVGDK